KTSAQVGITMDLTASILAATNTPVAQAARLEGLDRLPILSGRQPIVERTLFWRIAVPGKQQRAVRQGDWKLIVDGDETHLLLFDLKKDIGERHDVAVARPDVVTKLRRSIRDWEEDVDDEARSLRPARCRSLAILVLAPQLDADVIDHVGDDAGLVRRRQRLAAPPAR